jgi:hypothetical protein
VARILIVAGGCRGRELASEMVGDGHAVRITTRTEAGRVAIERTGAECWVGTPARLATLRGALDSVTIACWLLASAGGPEEEVRPLHGSRLQLFLEQAIDTTVRGVLYETGGSTAPSGALAEGERIAATITRRNAIPIGYLRSDPANRETWLKDAREAVEKLLGGR